jgi:hypothetical protein
MEGMKREIVTLICVLSVGLILLASQVEWNHHPYRETVALVQVRKLCQSEIAFRSQNGHFGTIEELKLGSYLQDWTKDRLDRIRHSFRANIKDHEFTIQAWPWVRDSDGRRTFYCDQTGILRQSWDGSQADSRSAEVK